MPKYKILIVDKLEKQISQTKQQVWLSVNKIISYYCLNRLIP